MINRKYKRLIRKHFEGDLSPKERDRLEKGMQEVEGVKAYFESMSRVDELLTDSAVEISGTDLKDSVMQSIRQLQTDEQTRAGMRKSPPDMNPWVRTMSQAFVNPHWNLAYAFIAGILITSLLFSLVFDRSSSGSFSEQDLTGAMSNNHSAATLTLPVELPDVKIDLQAYSMPQDFIQVTLDIDSEKPCLINLFYNNSAFQVWSLRAMQNNPHCEILSAYKEIRIGNSGRNSYTLLLKKLTYVGEEIILDLYIEGNLEYSTHFEI
ncbi:MAG: hypothetical protein PHD61_10790 [Bacteroidales bacterium]|nr:hypothetical protein [Lentimicrobiaceae bacterium]MDD5695774.1 hypothetical protein [Bacteroidales bacterium]